MPNLSAAVSAESEYESANQAAENEFMDEGLVKFHQNAVTTVSLSSLSSPSSTTVLSSPYKAVPLLYCDHTASSKPLSVVEDYISTTVLPTYANTHTTTSHCGAQTTAFVAEARGAISDCINANTTGKAKKDVVLFAGSGVTGAIDKYMAILDVCQEDTVVVGPWEHHSNLIPYRTRGCDIHECPILPNGDVDYPELSALMFSLRTASPNSRMFCAFTAASNVSGRILPLDPLLQLCSQHDFLSVIDYATAGPYVKVDVTGIDVSVFSAHKFTGGPGGTGVLCIKKALVSSTTPVTSNGGGGGTVFYVTKSGHKFTTNRVERWEGGTPDVVGCVRAGMAFMVKRMAGVTEEKEVSRNAWVTSWLKTNAPNVVILDNHDTSLPIVPFLIRFQERFLHYNFVCSLLNDLFGVQTRGGCMCAGGWSQRILGLTDSAGLPNSENVKLESALVDRCEVLRPGYTRFSLPTSVTRREAEYALQAVKFVSEWGWLFMLEYAVEERTGVWRHKKRLGKPLGKERLWLHDLKLDAASDESNKRKHSVDLDVYNKAFDEALPNAHKEKERILGDNSLISRVLSRSPYTLPEEWEELRWFSNPSEAAAWIEGGAGLESQTFEKYALKGPVVPPVALGKGVGEGSSLVTPIPSTPLPPRTASLFHFRAAEGHEGEATLSEISEGLESGEIDESCMLYIDGGWVNVMEVVNQEEEVKKEEVMDSRTQNHIVEEEEKKKEDNGLDDILPVPPPSTKPKKTPPLPKKLMKKIGEAIMQWSMISPGDRLLLGLSGGKDSLTLLHALLAVQKKAPIKFEVACCTIDPGTDSFDPSPLIPYVESLGVKYFYVRESIVEKAATSGPNGGPVTSLCSYCARMKRGLLYSTAQTNGYNKLVLAQHLDDCAESFFMSAMKNGFLRTMKANYKVGDGEGGDLSVIRPLVYVRENVLRDYALKANLPVINENCPACFEEPKERARVKKLLSKEENLSPILFDSIKRALIPLMDKDVGDRCREFGDEVVERGRREGEMRKGKHGGGVKSCSNDKKNQVTPPPTSSSPVALQDFTVEELERELERRKKAKLSRPT
eukprot:CAMPEP_0118672442 /NCGR_PEP_ID=MMETSP0785-20121206/22541_1 /TAXON_ID=91992 /ORGANISM="Bolidomonas pacifica, Strain CCMP 1866" /LENGTH=1068 /DNA_ID=CAMNT_0006567401 /DNA_START=18 /DNA_END=3221 /DNA_ORIENTATION=-